MPITKFCRFRKFMFHLFISKPPKHFGSKLEKSALPYFLNFKLLFSLFWFDQFSAGKLASKLETFPNRWLAEVGSRDKGAVLLRYLQTIVDVHKFVWNSKHQSKILQEISWIFFRFFAHTVLWQIATKNAKNNMRSYVMAK